MVGRLSIFTYGVFQQTIPGCAASEHNVTGNGCKVACEKGELRGGASTWKGVSDGILGKGCRSTHFDV